AMTAYKRALRLSPDNPGILNGIGNCYRADGNVIKARTYYERALEADPNGAEIMYNLTLLQQYRLDAPLVRELRRLYGATACTGQSRALVSFALARIHEGHGDLQGAFRYYAEANDLQFPLVKYDEGRYIALFEQIEATFTSQLFRRLGQV